MKIQKALKTKMKLVGEIATLKHKILSKNSYTEGSVDPEKYCVDTMYAQLLTKIQDLIGLKYAINEANREIQAKLYSLSEFKSLVAFWNGVNVTEGTITDRYGSANTPIKYIAQVDEITRDNMVAQFQLKIDALQEEIDTFNHTTDIPWEEFDVSNSKEEESLPENVAKAQEAIKSIRKEIDNASEAK